MQPEGGYRMNRIRILLVAVLVLGVSSLVFSQEPDDKEPKAPPKQETPHDVAPPRAQKDQEEKTQKPGNQEVQKPDSKKQDKDNAKANRDEKDMNNGGRAQTANAGPAGKGARIPDAKFKSSFGQQHRFVVNRVITQRTVVVGQTQFVYSGYTFVFMDPWPAGWAYTDDCYIDYINDEYVLVDVLHPGVYITLTVIS
jgi:flagellum-specific peptidoglycan hydrolase FlgJ